MTDWRTDEQIEQDGRGERWIAFEFAILLIGFVTLLLRGFGLIG